MKRKTVFLSIALLLNFFFIQLNIFGQISSDIVYSIKTGNASKLVTYFNEEIEIAVESKEYSYNIAQAELLLKDFFLKNKPGSFEIKHDGEQGDSYFMVGKLITNNGNYRTYIYLKTIKNKKYIYQLRFESEYE